VLSDLHRALRTRDVVRVRELIAAGADLAARTPAGRTPLHIAAEEGLPEAVEALLAAGAEADARRPGGETALHVAALGGPVYDVMDDDEDVRAAADGKVESVLLESLMRTLLPDAGTAQRVRDELADPAKRERLLAELQRRGIAREHLDEFLGLLERIADPRDAHLRVMALLLDAGADANAADASGETPLQFAIGGGRDEAVRLLLDRGADARRGDPLREAVSYGRPASAAMLLDRGAEVTPAAMHLAAANGAVGLLALFLDRGAPADLRGDDGSTPLMAANDHLEAVTLLLSRGADRGARDAEGRTAWDLASEWLRGQCPELKPDA
jgi:ankyrin repeat protein